MTPEIFDPKNLLEGIEPDPDFYFYVDLDNSTPFDIDKFDKLNSLVGDPGFGGLETISKFICVDDKLYVFPYSTTHNAFFKEMGFTKQEIQCAGNVSVGRNGDRYLKGSSSSLDQSGILSRGRSDKYKNTVLKEGLAPFFEIGY